MTLRSVFFLGLSVASVAALPAFAQDTAGPPPARLLIYPKEPLFLPYLAKCSAAVTVINGGPKDISSAPYLLDTSGAMKGVFRGHWTLYNQAGEELLTITGMRTAGIVQQICRYFEGIRAGLASRRPADTEPVARPDQELPQ